MLKTNSVHVLIMRMAGGLTKKAEPPPTRDVNRDSGTESANGGWLRRLVRQRTHNIIIGCLSTA
jgi:hypothetical protein